MQKPTRYLKLPFQFDEEKLVRDLSLILDGSWVPHFNKADYSGDWKVIALYAPNGDASDIIGYATLDSTLSETPILKKCRYLKEVIDTFHCPILTARILRLGVGAEIKPHTDYKLGYEDGNFRLHIPIVTNPDVQFILDGDRLTMLPGECWYTNVNYVHSVTNAGKTDRVHLVIDGERNEWTDQLFFSLAPAESFQDTQEGINSPETIQRIIKELERIDAPAVEPLIKDLRQQLNDLNK